MTLYLNKTLWLWKFAGLMVKNVQKTEWPSNIFFLLAFKLQLALHILTKYINVIPYPYTLPISRQPNPHLWSRKAYNRSTGSSLHLSSWQLAPRGRSRHFTQGDGPGHQLWCHFKDIRSHKDEKKKKSHSQTYFLYPKHFSFGQVTYSRFRSISLAANIPFPFKLFTAVTSNTCVLNADVLCVLFVAFKSGLSKLLKTKFKKFMYILHIAYSL